MLQNPLSKETLEENLNRATTDLLELARETTWNNIADNCLFILSESNQVSGNAARKVANDRKAPKTLAELMPDLLKLYDKLYEFDLFVYKSSKNQTIIEIEYTLKWPETAALIEPSLRTKIQIPFYAAETKIKFDINWTQNNPRHKWNMFWARLGFKVFLSRRKFKMWRNSPPPKTF